MMIESESNHSNSSAEEFVTHVCNSYDTLTMLALKFDVRESEIARHNGLLHRVMDLDGMTLKIPHKGADARERENIKSLMKDCPGMTADESRYYCETADQDVFTAKINYEKDKRWADEESNAYEKLAVLEFYRCSSDIVLTGGIVTHDFIIFLCHNGKKQVFMSLEKVPRGILVRKDEPLAILLGRRNNGNTRNNPRIVKEVTLNFLLPFSSVVRSVYTFLNKPYSLTSSNCKHFANSVVEIIENENKSYADRCALEQQRALNNDVFQTRSGIN